jgi:uracil-DNA glycosylase
MKPTTITQLGDWYQEFPKFWESPGVNDIIKYISKEYQLHKVYPEPSNIFKAFELCQYKDLKAVIIGMDPYNNGNATGLAFGVNTISINPSLVKIKQAIEREVYNNLLLEFDYSLEYLAKQGVLLLNSALTVRHGLAGSHSKIWADFTKSLLVQISVHREDVLWFLWGSHAKEFKQYIYPSPETPIFEAEHPAYAARQGKPWNSNNQFINTNHIIKW